MSAEDNLHEFEALEKVIAALRPLENDVRHRILRSAITFLGIEGFIAPSELSHLRQDQPFRQNDTPGVRYSEDLVPSPKAFLFEKQPRTDVERIACLAYYLTQYREIQYFKTLDLSKLNTEAAQPKFSNPTVAANNAFQLGYLVPAVKGQRQLSAMGEQYVRALPDRVAAKAVMEQLRRSKRNRKKKQPQSAEEGSE